MGDKKSDFFSLSPFLPLGQRVAYTLVKSAISQTYLNQHANPTPHRRAHPEDGLAFEPGARTDWHAHSGPQLLYVVEGRCRVQAWGEAMQEVGPGDTVYIAPDEKHWHGAAPATGTVHIAVNIDARTTWLERVSEEQYG